ncbi:hypothetical protein HZC31_06715 [Candidatus Woesearchaeota archaeon]|nr:hypothetical protein [Candidatus Woesearchaeota archaeon]
MKGVFCDVYGDTIENQVLEYLLENQDLDVAVGDMAYELTISRPKAYQVIALFEGKRYVQKSRIIGNTQLYKLNKADKHVQLFLRDFKECLRLVVEEHQTSTLIRSARVGVASVKRVRR